MTDQGNKNNHAAFSICCSRHYYENTLYHCTSIENPYNMLKEESVYKNMIDKQLFEDAYITYIENKDYYHFYNSIKDLNITDNALFYYYKAHWAYKKEQDYQTAEEYIKKCEFILSKGQILDIGEYFPQSEIILNPSFPIMTKDNFCDFYQMAGEVHAINGLYKEALKSYQKYQYYVEQVKNDVLDEKENITLYSFRKFNEYTLADLINKQITVCHPSKMNDPFDSIATMWGLEKNLQKICKNAECNKYIPIFSESFKYFRIRSFVANKNTYEPDDSILSNILMWSFYADEHRGFCIKYKLSKHFIKKPRNSNYCHLRILPVNYAPEYDLSNKTYIDTDASFGYKNNVWRNEDEVRLISYNTITDSPFWGEKLDENSKIEEIIFGFKCPPETKDVIYNLIKNYESPVKLSEIVQDERNVYCLRKQNYERS